jgi:hypothetical protein
MVVPLLTVMVRRCLAGHRSYIGASIAHFCVRKAGRRPTNKTR